MQALKPVFIGWLTFLNQLSLTLFMSIWCGGFFGGFAKTLKLADADDMGVHIDIGVGFFVLFSLAAYLIKRQNYANTEYRLLDDRIEIVEGFMTERKKIISYTAIREVSLRRGALQKGQDLGSVYLATDATGSPGGETWNAFFGASTGSGSGVLIMDIRDADLVYQRLQSVINQDR